MEHSYALNGNRFALVARGTALTPFYDTQFSAKTLICPLRAGAVEKIGDGWDEAPFGTESSFAVPREKFFNSIGSEAEIQSHRHNATGKPITTGQKHAAIEKAHLVIDAGIISQDPP